MKTILTIGLGSFIGGMARYVLTVVVQEKFLSSFPFGTLVVNIIGCFLIGVVIGLFDAQRIDLAWRLFLTTGILGGFTTFSAFSNETFGMLRAGQMAHAFIYVLVSIGVGLLATWAGHFTAKAF